MSVIDRQRQVQNLKRQIGFCTNQSLKETIDGSDKGESSFIGRLTGMYLRCVCDPVMLIVDTTETFRHIVSEMRHIYLSAISGRMTAVQEMTSDSQVSLGTAG